MGTKHRYRARCRRAGYHVLVFAIGVMAARAHVSAQTPAQSAPAEPEAYLRTLGLSESLLRAADEGQTVVKLLKTESDRDVAVFGLVVVRASRDAIVARALALHGFIVTQPSPFGVFSDPPTAADVSAVAFDRSEYKGLRSCRPGDCEFKLSASAMRSFIDGVDWSSPNAKTQADERLQADLLRLVTDYRSRGDAAIPAYDDGPGVLSADAFAALLAQSGPTLTEYAPELYRYLTTYPLQRPDSATDFLYWSEERRPRMRPTVRVNHVVVYAAPNGAAYIARKQIYASHYFEGELELLALFNAGAPGAPPATYLITVRRYRFDNLPGGILNVRGRVRSHMVDQTRDDLTRERAAIERPGDVSPSPTQSTSR